MLFAKPIQADRFTLFMETLISRDQTGIMKKRCIGKNLRLGCHLLNNTERKAIVYLMIIILWFFIMGISSPYTRPNNLTIQIKNIKVMQCKKNKKKHVLCKMDNLRLLWPQKGCRHGYLTLPYTFCFAQCSRYTN